MNVACPACGLQLDIPEDYLGKKVRCAACSTVFEARSDGGPPPDSAPPPSVGITEQPPPPREEMFPERAGGDIDRQREYDDLDRQREADERGRIRRDVLPHRGGLILGLGIGSIVTSSLGVCCCALLALIGIPLGATSWIMGMGDLAKMKAGTMDSDGRGNTQAGYICGIIGCIIGVVAFICLALSLFFNIGTMLMNPKNFK
jgi:predicted Zn finger-like uncharacterized protein